MDICSSPNRKAMNNQMHRLAIAICFSNILKSKSRRSPDSEQDLGFSLLESLVAVAVVSILIVSIAPMVALSTSARINARRVDQATQAARSYIDAVRGGIIDTTNFPSALISNTVNSQGQYMLEVNVPTNSTSLSASSNCQAVTTAVLGSASVLGTCVDANGNGFSVNDPQDLFVQPMRTGVSDNTLKLKGFSLAVRVYRADALSGSAALRKGTEDSCGQSKTAFSSTASVTCPIVTMRSQIFPTVDSGSLDGIVEGIGSK